VPIGRVAVGDGVDASDAPSTGRGGVLVVRLPRPRVRVLAVLRFRLLPINGGAGIQPGVRARRKGRRCPSYVDERASEAWRAAPRSVGCYGVAVSVNVSAPTPALDAVTV
jgi:hypothetical protein